MSARKRCRNQSKVFSKEQVAAFEIIPGDAVVREFIGGSTIKIPHNE